MSDERLLQLYREALGVYFGPFDEDYGYVTIEGFAASRPVVTLGRQRRSARVRARGRDRARAPARAQGDRRGVRPPVARSRRGRAHGRGRATRSCAPRCRAGPTSSRGCSTDAAGACARRAACAAPGAGVEVRARAGAGFAGRRRSSPGRCRRRRPASRPTTGPCSTGSIASGSPTACASTSVWPVGTQDAGRFPGYHLGVFQLGNNVEFHLEIYRAAYLTSALVVLHDLALDDFVRGLKAAGEPLGYMAAREAGAAAARAHRSRRDPQRAAARAVVRPRRPSRARGDRAFRLRPSLPRGLRMPHARVRGAASRDRGARSVRARPRRGPASCGRASGLAGLPRRGARAT